MIQVFLSLGTNLGDRCANLRRAIEGLQAAMHIEAQSAVYETAPWGPIADQPNFYNLCLEGRSALEPRPLLDFVKALEQSIGRETGTRWGPRLIDIDILFYGDQVLEMERLRLPHPQIAERAFVLVPLADIASDFVHPELHQSVGALREAVDESGVRRLDEGCV